MKDNVHCVTTALFLKKKNKKYNEIDKHMPIDRKGQFFLNRILLHFLFATFYVTETKRAGTQLQFCYNVLMVHLYATVDFIQY